MTELHKEHAELSNKLNELCSYIDSDEFKELGQEKLLISQQYGIMLNLLTTIESRIQMHKTCE